MQRAMVIVFLISCQGNTTGGGTSGGSAGDGGGAAPSQALTYLLASPATHLDIDIDYVTGLPPNNDALSQFSDHLNGLKQQDLLAKPNGISINLGNMLPANSDANHAYSTTEVQALFDAKQSAKSAGDNAVAYFIYLDGHSDQDTSSGQILGFAFGGDRIVMFANTIKTTCSQSGGLLGGASSCALAEATVLSHEFGHLMGLVNNGIAMKNAHQDTAHGAHCNNQNCLMYWTVNNSSSLIGFLGSSQQVPAFDQACLDDLGLAQSAH